MRGIVVSLGALWACAGVEVPEPEPIEPRWFYDLPHQGDGDVFVKGLAFDRAGGLAVSVQQRGVCGALYKLSSEGALAWQQISVPSDPEHRCAHDFGVAIDRDDNLVTLSWAGRIGPQSISDIFVRKHDPQGGAMWTQPYAGPGDGYSIGESVAVDRAGNIVAAGAAAEGNSSHRPWLAKYAPDGAPRWLHDTEVRRIRWGGVRADRDGNVVVAGDLTHEDFSSQVVVRKLDPEGNTVWERTLQDGPLTTFAAHEDGSCLVGWIENIDDLSRTRLIKLDRDGNTVFDHLSIGRMVAPDGMPVRFLFSWAAIAGDGTIHLLSEALIERCGELCWDRAAVLTTITPRGEVVKTRIYQPTSHYSYLQTDAIAVGDRGQLAIGGQIQYPGGPETGFVAVFEPD